MFDSVRAEYEQLYNTVIPQVKTFLSYLFIYLINARLKIGRGIKRYFVEDQQEVENEEIYLDTLEELDCVEGKKSREKVILYMSLTLK